MNLFRTSIIVSAVAAFLLNGTSGWAQSSFTLFESGQVRPLALSPDGTRLFAVNTPDNQLEIFAVNAGVLSHLASVPVGLEPVAVAARSNSEVWVVNHLSDSVSIVDVSATPPRTATTLLVGDEPRDIVFAGAGGNRAFITTAHRGQQRIEVLGPIVGDPQLTTPGVNRADVWVFDATNLGAGLGGVPIAIVSLFGDTPRALAVADGGNTVYAAVFHSGNQTTAVNEGAVCDDPNLTDGLDPGSCSIHGVTMPNGLPQPETNYAGVPRPETGLVVKYNPTLSRWEDQRGENWNPAVKFSLPDYDVFAIDATATPPVETASYPGVGTVLFNMIANPSTNDIYVSNTEAINEVRFEGPGIFGGSTVNGHLHEARITWLDTSGGTVHPRHLNKHINYSIIPSPAGVKDVSLAQPMGMAINSTGTTLYVAAFGSSKVGVYGTSDLEGDSFVPASITHIPVSGGGPSGLVLDETNGKLYVLTRFNNSVSVIDTGTQVEEDSLPLNNPEPNNVINGRHFLYDAYFTSSNGETSCASCHIFGDFDSLAWDLGNPDDDVLDNLNGFRVSQPAPPALQSFPDHHPMKGPMTTQSLRGLANNGPMHWRGDRSGANDMPPAPGGFLNESAAFNRFNVAFVGLLGRGSQLTPTEMQAFTDFILDVKYPPNPIRALDDSLTPDETAGRNFYFGPMASDVFNPCNGCHVLAPAGGSFGTDGFSSFENERQLFKIAHLRNLYQKVGMFGMPAIDFLNTGNNGSQGDQVRGFGFLHDGSIDTVFRFLNATVFNQVQFGFPINPGGFANGAPGDPLRRQVESFLLAFDSDLKPMVGQQITLTDTNSATVDPRINTMLARAAAGDCEVVAKAVIGSEPHGWVRASDGLFHGDREADTPISDTALRAMASTPGQEITFTCVPPGSGERIGVDRDGDCGFDYDEIDQGSDPANKLNDILDKPVLKVVKNALPTGDDKLILKGDLSLCLPPAGLDPSSTGVSLRIADSNGVTIFTRTIPPGLAPIPTASGWKVNSKGNRWTFKDLPGTLADGIFRVVIREKKTPGFFHIVIKGRNDDFHVDTAQLPARALVSFDAAAFCASQPCGARKFNAVAGAGPYCRQKPNGDVICR